MGNGRNRNRPVAILVVMAGVCLGEVDASDTGSWREPSSPSSGSGKPAGQADGGAPLSLAAAGMDLLRRGDLEGAEPYLSAAIEAFPDHPGLLQALGSVYARTDRFHRAEELLRRSLRVQPDSFGALLGLGTVLADTGRYQEALGTVERALQLKPEHPVAAFKKAFLLSRLGRGQEAETAARQAIAVEDGNPEAHYFLGSRLAEREAFDEAAMALRRALELAQWHLGALNRLALVEARRGHVREAERLREAHRTALAHSRVEDRVRDLRRAGIDAFNRGDLEEALKIFLRILGEDPADPQVRLHLGSTYVALGLLDEAQKELERGLELAPHDERLLTELARVFGLRRRLDEAVRLLNQAIIANPHFAEPHYLLAGIHMARGDENAARQEMESYRTLRDGSSGGAYPIEEDPPPAVAGGGDRP